MNGPTRRRLLTVCGAAMVGIAGCNSIGGRNNDDDEEIKDTDGDGVIDSEDYAPRDPEVQRKEQVNGDSTSTEDTTESNGDSTSTEDTTESNSDSTSTEDTTERTVIDNFETGIIEDQWVQGERGSVSSGREGFYVQSDIAPQGDYALRGRQGEYTEHSAIKRDDFTIDRDGTNLQLSVRLGPVLTGSERANIVWFKNERGRPIIDIDQKDRGDYNSATIGNGSTPNSVMESITQVELQNIRFSDNMIGEVIVGGNTVATNLDFKYGREASAISAVEVYQSHFGVTTDIIVDNISFEIPST